MAAVNHKTIIQSISAEIPNVPWVSPLWTLIFSEQNKGSHLLFSPLDRLNFGAKLKDLGLTYQELGFKNLKKIDTRIKQVIFELVCATNLQDAIAVVDGCDAETRFELFKISKVISELVPQENI
jgi:hypothetical protein